MNTGVYAVPAATGHVGLAASLAAESDFAARQHRRVEFVNGNQLVEIDLDQNPTDVNLVVLTPSLNIGADLIEFALLADSLARHTATATIAILTYVPYSRSCRLTGQGQALGAAVFAKLLESAPIDHIITFDLHARELIGFFTRPVTSWTTLPWLAEHLTSENPLTVIGPDRGRYDDCRDLADLLRCDFDLLLKIREGHEDRSRLLGGLHGSLAGRSVVLYDDEVTRGLTAMHALESIVAAGAEDITFVTPYDFAAESVRRQLLGVAEVTAMITTNLGRPADPVEAVPGSAAYRIIDTAPMVADRLRSLLGRYARG